MARKFKLAQTLPRFQFDVVRLLLPSAEKKAKVLGKRISRQRDEIRRSREAVVKYRLEDTVLQNFKRKSPSSKEEFVNLYPPGLAERVQQILEDAEKKGLIETRGQS